VAEAEFSQRAMGDSRDKHLEKLRARCANELEALHKRNDKGGEKVCRELLEQLYRELVEPKLKAKKLVHSTLVTEVKSLLAKYNEKARGRAKHEALGEFLASRLPDVFLIMDQQHTEQVGTEHAKVVRELKDEIAEHKREKKEQKQEFDLMRQAFDSERKRYLEEINQLREELAAKNKKLKQLEKLTTSTTTSTSSSTKMK
jgi:hypothetical protein